MSMVAPLVLATAVNFTPYQFVPPDGRQQKEDARRAVTKALYHELEFEKYVENIEKKYVTDEVRKYGPWIVAMIKIQQEKRVSIEWTF